MTKAHNVFEPQLTIFKLLLWSNQQSKPKYSSFAFRNDKEKQHILTCKKLEQANVLKFLLDNWHKRLIDYHYSCLLIHTNGHLQTHTDTQTAHSHIFLHERVLQVQRPRWRTWQGYAHGSMCNSTSLRSMATLTLGGAETERAHGPVTARHPSSTSASETNASQPAAKYRTWNTWWNMQLRASALVRSGVGRPLVTYFLTD